MKETKNNVYQRWTKEESKKVRDMWANGKSDDDIAQMLGRTGASIRNHRSLNGMIVRKNRATLKQDAKYTKYLPAKRSISLLWGAIKVEL